jgi:hypothetical protein
VPYLGADGRPGRGRAPGGQAARLVIVVIIVAIAIAIVVH